MPPELLRDAQLLRTVATGRPIGVDREANILRGYVVAQLGPFKSRGRGEFDQESLDTIIRLGNEAKQGLKSRFSHPTECDDGLGKYLGRTKDLFMGSVVTNDGKTIQAVRADLHFDATALQEPPSGGKPLGIYVMDLAESDPDAISSSLVLRVDKQYRRKPDGTLETGPDGEELPPLWRPKKLMGSDVVDTGDAVDGILSAEGLSTEGLPNELLWKGADLLDGLFVGLAREELASRLSGWLDRYLDHRFGPAEPPATTPAPATTPQATQSANNGEPSLSHLLLRQRQRERELLN